MGHDIRNVHLLYWQKRLTSIGCVSRVVVYKYKLQFRGNVFREVQVDATPKTDFRAVTCSTIWGRQHHKPSLQKNMRRTPLFFHVKRARFPRSPQLRSTGMYVYVEAQPTGTCPPNSRQIPYHGGRA